MAYRTHIVFFVDASKTGMSGVPNFINEVVAGSGCSWETYTFNNGTPVWRDEPLNFRRSGEACELYKSLLNVIDRTGKNLAVEAEYARPEKVLFVLVVGNGDTTGDETARSEVVEAISRQYYGYKWRFMTIGQNAKEVGAKLELFEHMSMNATVLSGYAVSEMRRVIYDAKTYGDCGFRN